MKLFRFFVLFSFAAAVVLLCLTVYESSVSDKTLPVLKLDADRLEISVSDSRELLLSGVTAFDAKDGDLTDKIYVESVSQFISPGQAIITYAVCDSDNHVVKASRNLIYTDYTSPVFYLKDELRYTSNKIFAVLDNIGATDLIDGDISDNIILVYSDIQARTAGEYRITVRAANSMGDTVKRDFTVYVEQKDVYQPVLKLKEYLIYVNVGETVTPSEYIEAAYEYDGETEIPLSKVRTRGAVRYNTEGVYTIPYSVDYTYIPYDNAEPVTVTEYAYLTVDVGQR